MKKFFTVIICFIVLFSIGGCRREQQYRYMHDISNVNSIEIVRVNKNENIGPDFQTTLLIIEDKEQFLNDLSAIGFRRVFGYAYPIERDNTIAVKLIYNNNDYELITAQGGATYRFSEDYYYPYGGEMTCDASEFNALIEKYMQMGYPW